VDYADPAAWAFWVDAIRAAHPAPVDFSFSSEDYGAELARRLGAQPVSFDPARARVPISGAEVRADPLAHWQYLPPPVRPYYVRRVALVGAESTGKTTLAQALAAQFETVWSPEYARAYLLARGGVCTEADMHVIAQGQAESEERLARQANRVLIGDTNVLTTQLWYEHYFGPPPAALRQLAAERRAHLYLLCAPDVPWVADELRDSPGERAWFHQHFQQELAATGAPVVTLSGPFEARLAPALAAVRDLLAR
jgi:NadR type nicotinamide-nucleotide adenylyltransferase